jgi:hypothetical protein
VKKLKAGVFKKWRSSGMKDVPLLSSEELFVVSIGASEFFSRNQIDLCLFISLPIVPP